MLTKCKTCLPAAEVRENENSYSVMIEFPGSSRDDVKVWQEKNILTITGEKKAPEGNRVWNERVYGKFERSFRLPQDADREKIEANYAEGVISITIPKLEVAKPKDIKVN